MCVCVYRLSVVILCEFFNALLVGWQVGVARLKRPGRVGQGRAGSCPNWAIRRNVPSGLGH